MPRAIWKGVISFGLVTIPVGLYSAVERAKELSFRLLHEKDESPIDYRRFCEKEDVEVDWDEIVKGYEKARVPATQTFDIQDFVPVQAIPPYYFDHPYYLAPSGKAGEKAYALLRDALAQTDRVGIGTVVLRQREHLAALQPVGEALVLTTMRFSYELRSPAALDLPRSGAARDKKQRRMAEELIDKLAGEWKPEKYKDTYHEVLMKTIERKAEGKDITAPAPERPGKVVDLMEALQRSLKEGKRRPARARRKAA